ncbi:pectin acetylesterase-family hydrolase [Microbacterium sp. ZKA21]|uniref:pectin acetylesterase-family hydrolase n=1 Tax=Microbacterium sp. ZKA21 TaxID=3381694 RepID=UPI003D1F6246
MKSKKRWSRRRKVLVSVGIGVGAVALLGAGAFIAAQTWIHAGFSPLDPDSAEEGEWYSVQPDGAIDALGNPYHANIRVGSENKVMVVFGGGGVSVDDYTEARPVRSLFDDGFYTVLDGFDQLAKDGLAEDIDGNPFRDWTVIQLPYSTGDFHAGAGANEIEGLDGEPEVVHHNGRTNLELVLNADAVKEVLGSPSELLVAGGSAGGFGAAINTGVIMEHLPDTTNVTTMVDSSLLLYDWHSVSEDVWLSPQDVTDALHTDNFTLDALTALTSEHPEVKILFASSIRDESLARMQSYLNGGPFDVTAEDGIAYEQDLTVMVEKLQAQVPGIGLYIFEGETDDTTGLTQHTIGPNTMDELVGGTTPLEWVSRAVDGQVESFGVDLLE